jgi:hypothetical protein
MERLVGTEKQNPVKGSRVPPLQYCKFTNHVLRLTIASDAHPDMALEGFIWGSAGKNLLFYAFSTFINNWFASDGPIVVFFTLGGITTATILTSLPMCKNSLNKSLLNIS